MGAGSPSACSALVSKENLQVKTPSAKLFSSTVTSSADAAGLKSNEKVSYFDRLKNRFKFTGVCQVLYACVVIEHFPLLKLDK